MFEDSSVLAIQCSNTQNEQYAIFCNDKGLYHGNENDEYSLLAVLDNIIRLDRPIKIYYHFPFICITERYGLNAATVNIVDRSVIKFEREDYHADVSSYSAGFLEHNGRVLLIHQTQWNRLDITDLETKELLTRREVWIRDSGKKNEHGNTLYEQESYRDYFHSLLHVSPDYKYFLSNGWIWQPTDNIMCFETESFLKEYEACGENIGYSHGYAWDRPCTFVGNDMFVIAADKDDVTTEENFSEAELKEPPAYHQLLFYRLSEVMARKYTYSGYENYDTLPLAYSEKADCDVFTFYEYGEIEGGELHYDAKTGHLIVLSGKGVFELTLDGKIIHCNPEIKLSASNWAMRYDDKRAITHCDWLQNWQYDTIRHLFYRYNNNKIEKKQIRK